MNTKIAFGMIVFNGNYVLKECIENIYPFANQILISEGPVKYWQEQGFTTSTDGTNDILHEIYDPDKKIIINHGQYNEKDEQCNAYIKYLRDDNDYIWNLDSDELFKPEDVETLINVINEHQITTVGFKSLSFYGGFNHYLTGFEEGAEFIRIRKIYPGSTWLTHRPPTIRHIVGNPWPERHLNLDLTASLGIRMYHYSYVFPEQVRQKVQYYKAAVSKENCLDNYFEEVYMPWTTGNDSKKKEIEDKFHGVHEFKPSYRGECKTSLFTGQHPKIIQNNLNSLQEKFNMQLQRYI